jgi:hypothetical protein
MLYYKGNQFCSNYFRNIKKLQFLLHPYLSKFSNCSLTEDLKLGYQSADKIILISDEKTEDSKGYIK